MDGSEWLKIIVPVALSSCISIIITLVNNKIIKKKMAKKTLIQRRMRELLKHISAIKSAIISIECQLVNFEEGLEKYFISAGDLQVYLEDNKHAMLTEINKKEDIYSIKTIDDLSKKITEVGVLMKTAFVLSEMAARKVSGSGCRVSMLQRAGTSLP